MEPEKYRLEIEGAPHIQGVSLTLEDIQNLPPVTVTAAVMCAGNRRSEMSQVKSIDFSNIYFCSISIFAIQYYLYNYRENIYKNLIGKQKVSK